MLRILFYGFLIYLSYQLVFNFIIPVYRTTRRVKKGFQKMRDQVDEHNKQQASANSADQQSKQKAGEYIDFEEIK